MATTTQAEINFPFGPADVQTNTSGTGTLTPVVANAKTIIKYSGLTGAITLNLDIDDNVPVGAELVIFVEQGATPRNVTAGTGFHTDAPDLTGVANDTDVLTCVYDGTSFIPVTAWQKVFDAA